MPSETKKFAVGDKKVCRRRQKSLPPETKKFAAGDKKSLSPETKKGTQKNMYLHLGQNVVVPESSITGIFDMDNTTGSHITRNFLNLAEKKGLIISAADDIPKSFIVCNENNETKIYLSQLSSTTLAKRSETMRFD